MAAATPSQSSSQNTLNVKFLYNTIKRIITDKLREGYLVQTPGSQILDRQLFHHNHYIIDVYINDPLMSKGSRAIEIEAVSLTEGGRIHIDAKNVNPNNTIKHHQSTLFSYPIGDKRVYENVEETFLKWLDISTHEPYTQRDQLFNEYLEDVERSRIAEEAWRREAGRRKMRMDVFQRGMRHPSNLSNTLNIAHQRNDLLSLPPEIISEINRHVMTRMPFAYRSYYPIQNTGSPWLYPKF